MGMAVPDYQTLMLPIVQITGDGQALARLMYDRVDAAYFEGEA